MLIFYWSQAVTKEIHFKQYVRQARLKTYEIGEIILRVCYSIAGFPFYVWAESFICLRIRKLVYLPLLEATF